jgi:WD40 repeat protein
VPFAASFDESEPDWGSISSVVVDQYEHHRNLPELRGRVNSLTSLLIKSGFAEHEVLLPRTASFDQVDQAIRQWRPHGGRAILYWAGHGKSVEGGDFYLCCPATPSRSEPDGRTAITARHLADLLVDKRVQQLVLIVDACGSGGCAGQIADAFRLKVSRTAAGASLPGLSVITSAAAHQKAREDAFSRALTKVLTEGAPDYPGSLLWTDRDEFITPPDLADALRRVMEDPAFSPYRQSPEHHMVNSVGRFFPNPRYRGSLPDVEVEQRRSAFLDVDIVEHFMVKFRGIDAGAQTGWYFTGREEILRDTVTWMAEARNGMRVVTGRPGCGKSAVLGRLAVLSSGKYRDMLTREHRFDDAPAGTMPERDAIDAGVHAKGRTLMECVQVLADALEIATPEDGWQTAGEFIHAVAKLPGRTTVMLDALDEAAADNPHIIATDLLQPLAELHRVKVLVGTRPGLHTGDSNDRSLLTALGGNPAAEVWLDRDAGSRTDIKGYALIRLLDTEGSPYRNAPAIADVTADRIAERADGAFLIARLLAGTLSRRQHLADIDDTPSLRPLTSSVGEALADDLDRYGADRRRAEDLLTALAWAEGAGMPARDVWSAVAGAVSGRTYTDRDLRWVVDNARGHIVESSEEGQTVYRLFHQAYADVFRLGADETATQAAITRELLFSVGDEPGARQWPAANPYLLRHLAAHAAAGDRLDELCLDPGFLCYADPGRLSQVLERVDHRSRPMVRLYWRSLHRLRRSAPANRPEILHEIAIREEPEAVALLPQTLRGPWWGVWSWTDRPTFHRALHGHVQTILALAPDHTGRGLIASASGDHTVRVWNAVTGEHHATFTGHVAPVLAAVLGRVGGRTVLVSGDIRGVIRAVDVDTGALLAETREASGFVAAFALVPRHGRDPVLVLGDGEGFVRQLTLPELAPVSRRAAHQDRIRAIVVAREPSGALVMVTAADDGRLSFWAPEDGRRLRSLSTRLTVNSLAAGVVGGRLLIAAGSAFGEVMIWDGNTCSLLAHCRGHSGSVGAVAFGSYGGEPILASAGDDGGVRLWDAVTGVQRNVLRASMDVPLSEWERRQGPPMELGGPSNHPSTSEDDDPPPYVTRRSNSLTALAFVAHDLRSVMLSGGSDGIVRLWHLDDVARQPAMAAPRIRTAAWGTFDGRQALVTLDQAGELSCWDALTGNTVATLPGTVQPHGEPVIVPAEPGDLIICATGDGGAALWQPAASPAKPGRLGTVACRTVELRRRGDDFFVLMLTTANNIVEVSLVDGSTRLVHSPTTEMRRLKYSQDTRFLALCGLRHEVLVVDAVTGIQETRLETKSPIFDMACGSVGGQPVLVAVTRDELIMWNLNSRTRLNEGWPLRGDGVTVAELVPATDLLVIGHRDGGVRILDASSSAGLTVLELPRHSEPVSAIACAVNATVARIATCGKGGIQVVELDVEHLTGVRPEPARVPRPRGSEGDDDTLPSRLTKLLRRR